MAFQLSSERSISEDRVIYFVVGDKKDKDTASPRAGEEPKGINSGDGIVVNDLDEMKGRLMESQQTGDWRLVISIHGAEGVIVNRGGDVSKNPQAKVYGPDDIRKLGDDEAFKKWREAYGPTWTTLNACQVHRELEGEIIRSFNKSNK